MSGGISTGVSVAKFLDYVPLVTGPGGGVVVAKFLDYVILTLPTADFGPIPIFPTVPQGFPIKVSPKFGTIIGTTKSLREMRVAKSTTPIWDFELVFEELKDQTQNQTPYAPFVGQTQYMQLVQLWLNMYGQANVFAFDAPWDDSRTLQKIGTGDGSSYVFTLYRTWGIAPNSILEAIGVINTISLVQVNGVTISSANYYAVRNKIYFQDSSGVLHPPGNGLSINVTMSYYYLCKFVEDEQDFEEFSKNRWRVPSLKFQSVQWP